MDYDDAIALKIALKALYEIANFGHTKGCQELGVPVYECGCYENSQWDIATEALRQIKNL